MTAAHIGAVIFSALAVLPAFAAAIPVVASRAPTAEGRGLSARVGRLLSRAASGGALSRSESRVLCCSAAAAGFLVGSALVDPLAGLGAALLVPGASAVLIRRLRQRFLRRIDARVPDMAVALANALSGGYAVRQAVVEVASEIDGPLGTEMGKAARQLAVGAGTEEVLTGLRDRTGSEQLGVVVAAILVHRRSGGDLARLLRGLARAADDRARAADEARTASAQARFTGKVVIAGPFVAILFGEVTAPGTISSVSRSFMSIWLVGAAIGLQIAGAAAMRRIARVN